MRRAALLVVFAGAAACSGPAQIDLTVMAGSSLADADVSRIRLLEIDVSGAEIAHATYPLVNPFVRRQERVVYLARASSGSVVFTATVRDAVRVIVGTGQAQASLGSGSARLVMLPVELPGFVPDGGVIDMAMPDLAGLCAAKPDGTSCGVGDSCHDAPTCIGGLCAMHNKTDGTACGVGDSCHDAPTCITGTCTTHNKTNGTVCAAAPNNCQSSGTCTGGVCGAITNKGSGTVCNAATDGCHTNGVCDGNGNCGAQGTYPESHSYDGQYLHRCCGGVPSNIDTSSNCGVCGINCNGRSCINTRGQYYCDCTANVQCWSNCCSTFYGSPYMCAAGNCSTNLMIPCPGGGTNGNNGFPGPYYCHY